jgi:hypothetical protein
MPQFGTLRAIFSQVYDEILKNDNKTESEIVRDGNKFDFALDGFIVNIDDKEDPALLDSEILIDFSIYPTEKPDDLVANFPYSCRGTRGNPKYIPLAKDTGYPILPQNKKFYYKITNTNTDYKLLGVAVVIFGYPVIGK